MTAIDPGPRGQVQDGPASAAARRGVAARIVLMVLGVALAVLLGANVSTVGYLLPITVAVGLCGLFVLSRLALERFEWFIWVLLLTRPLMDLSKPDQHAAAAPASQLATMVGAIVIVAGTVWFAAISRRGERLPMGVVSRALLLLTVTSLISVVVSRDPFVSFAQVARTTGAVVVLIVLEQLLRTRRIAMQTLVVCAFSAAIPLVVGLVQIPIVLLMPSVGSRINGTFLHPNTFGFFLVMLILVLYPLRRYLVGRARWAVTIGLLVAAVELVMTASRGSWIVLVLGFVVVGVLLKEERKIFWIGPTLVAMATVAFPVLIIRVVDLAAEDTVGGRPGNSASWRLEHYQTLLDKTDITLFGIGPRMTMSLSVGGQPPHNDALRMLLENGVVGLLCYLMFMIGMVLIARKGLQRLRTGFDRALAVAFTAVVVAFVFNSMGSNVITQFVLLIYLFALAAVVQALAHLATTPPAGLRVTRTQNETSEGSVHGNP